MSYLGKHRVSEHYYTEHVKDIHKTFVKLMNARHPDTNEPLHWNDRLFAQIHNYNFMYSFKEHCAGIYYNLLGHFCRCRSIDCKSMRPTKAKVPHSELLKSFRSLLNEYNKNSEYDEKYEEIVAVPRFITKPKTGEEVAIFVLGILDSQRDINNVLEMYSYPMQGWQNKIDRVLYIRDNLPQIRKEINQHQAMIDVCLNGKATP